MYSHVWHTAATPVLLMLFLSIRAAVRLWPALYWRHAVVLRVEACNPHATCTNTNTPSPTIMVMKNRQKYKTLWTT